jgi:hypothetical protein
MVWETGKNEGLRSFESVRFRGGHATTLSICRRMPPESNALQNRLKPNVEVAGSAQECHQPAPISEIEAGHDVCDNLVCAVRPCACPAQTRSIRAR